MGREAEQICDGIRERLESKCTRRGRGRLDGEWTGI